MADASSLSQTAEPWPTSKRRALLHRIGLAPLLVRRGRRIAASPSSERIGVLDARFPLLNAYAASAVEINRRAAELDLDPAGLALGPVGIQGLVNEAVSPLEPLAREANLALRRDSAPRSDGVCCADPSQLRAVLSHLLLRALCMEQVPGHVRVMVTLSGREAHILVLSRTPEATLAAHCDAARNDLIAPQRLLKAMGGSLVLEPRRAGYLPLCIALPALSAASARRAA